MELFLNKRKNDYQILDDQKNVLCTISFGQTILVEYQINYESQKKEVKRFLSQNKKEIIFFIREQYIKKDLFLGEKFFFQEYGGAKILCAVNILEGVFIKKEFQFLAEKIEEYIYSQLRLVNKKINTNMLN